MLAFIICASLLAISTDVVQGKYVYKPKIHGWIAQHKIIATWEEAYKQCRGEDYAMLASPVTEALRQEMASLIQGDTEYFIGTRANYYNGPYTSLEGIPLEDMAGINMLQQLDPREGQCLSMDRQTIRAVPCTKRLPFMCFKKQEEETRTLECGTLDPDYVFDYATHTCLKLHKDKKSWSQAFSTCVAEGAHLVVFSDESGAHGVKNLTIPADNNELLIGIQDRLGDGDWLSIYGQRVEELYNTWEDGRKPVNSVLRCGAMRSSGKLSSVSCDVEMPFICEKEPINTRFQLEEAN